jgi:hypothetical protein
MNAGFSKKTELVNTSLLKVMVNWFVSPAKEERFLLWNNTISNAITRVNIKENLIVSLVHLGKGKSAIWKPLWSVNETSSMLNAFVMNQECVLVMYWMK